MISSSLFSQRVATEAGGRGTSLPGRENSQACNPARNLRAVPELSQSVQSGDHHPVRVTHRKSGDGQGVQYSGQGGGHAGK